MQHIMIRTNRELRLEPRNSCCIHKERYLVTWEETNDKESMFVCVDEDISD